MFERVEIVDERGVEHVYVYESEADANSGKPWIHKYERYPEGVPNWQGFMNRLDIQTPENPEGTGLFEQMLQINPTLAWQGYNLCLNFHRVGKATEMEYRTLEFIYRQLAESLTAQQVQTLNQAIADFNIPVSLEEPPI